MKKYIAKKMSSSKTKKPMKTMKPPAAKKAAIKKRHHRPEVERFFDLEAAESEDGDEEYEQPENSSDRDFVVSDGEEGDGDEYTGPRMEWDDLWVDLSGRNIPTVSHSCKRGRRHCAKGLKRLKRADGSVCGEKMEDRASSLRHLEDEDLA